MRRFLFVITLLASSAQAEFKDGNRLLSEMNGDYGKQMNAIGYVTGVADALSSVTFCGPSNITAGQIYDMVKLYLENNPGMRHFTADVIIGRVIGNAWPCARRGTNL